MESIAELRKICQRHYSRDWLAEYVNKRISIYITALMVRTPITANHVTGLWILVGLLGFTCMAISPRLALLAGVLFYFWHVLDLVDGEVARYRRKPSALGIYLDLLGHYVVDFCIYMAFTVYLFHVTQRAELFYYGVGASFLIVLYKFSGELFELVAPHHHHEHEVDEMEGIKKLGIIRLIKTVLPHPSTIFSNIFVVVVFLLSTMLDAVYKVSIAGYPLGILGLIAAFYLVTTPLYSLLGLVLRIKHFPAGQTEYDHAH